MTILTKDRDGADLDIAAERREGIDYPLNHILDAAGAKINPATEATLAAAAASLVTLAARGTPVSRSGTITTGGTARQLMAANASRLGFAVQNVSTGDLWINDLGTAAASQPSLLLVAGAYYETPAGYGSVGAVSIFGATTGQAFGAREW